MSSTFTTSLVSGAAAGCTVDLVLYPLDTIKTRLQAPAGFWRSGGFKGVYAGIGSVLMGSAPSAALFFVTYDQAKQRLSRHVGGEYAPVVHMASASMGEMMACLVRVPTDVVKQLRQAGVHKTIGDAATSVLAAYGPRGFYVAYWPTLIREVPFASVQFPLYEYLKKKVASAQGKEVPQPWQSALCGSVAGGIAAAVTTPLDVVKTRVTLRQSPNGVPYKGFVDAFKRVYHEEGAGKLFAGVQPRVLWISIGGALFLGMYEQIKSVFARDQEELSLL